jgi:glyoxylase-like metal-dependent hydrolase (beta-lactamase superfamily II)
LRLIALHADVIVAVSRVWQTTCTAVRHGEEGFLIDSPVYPDELEALPDVLSQAGFPVSALVVTHADWDHLLGRLAFPDLALGCGETTASRLAAEPGAAQRALRDFDQEHYVEDRRPLTLGGLQRLPVPGKLSIGSEHELELHPADGHTADGMAVWIPWAAVLVCGDYISPVEIPMLSPGGSAGAYAATLTRLRPLVAHAQTVVPGHGGPISAPQALSLLDEDLAYLRMLPSPEASVPASRSGTRQRQIHEQNRRAVRAER